MMRHNIKTIKRLGMVQIKKFESFAKFYWEIDSEEYHSYLSKSMMMCKENYGYFTEREIRWLRENIEGFMTWIKDIPIKSISRGINMNSAVRYHSTNQKSVESLLKDKVWRMNFNCLADGHPQHTDNIPFDVYKLSDDWFIVWMKVDGLNEFWKCDQFDGLVRLIKDKGVI